MSREQLPDTAPGSTTPVPWRRLGEQDAGACVDGVCELTED